jgi:hypothetical protein
MRWNGAFGNPIGNGGRIVKVNVLEAAAGQMSAEESRAILMAYKRVMEASWPNLHPAMTARSSGWAHAVDAELRAELADYLREASRPDFRVRIFWKVGTGFAFGGCNAAFARDAGFTDPAEVVGLDDFDERLPWTRQASKYREDDEQVFYSGTPKLDIIERQSQTESTLWVRAGKAPIQTAHGSILGILGMYEILDSDVGRKLYAERLAR